MASLSLEFDKSVDEMTNDELRAKVAHKTGHRPPKSTLNKEILNSVNAWFSGTFKVKPARLKPGVPPRDELLTAVTNKASNELRTHVEGYGEDEENPLDDYHETVLTSDGVPRPLNKTELRDLIKAMDSRGDRRDWTN